MTVTTTKYGVKFGHKKLEYPAVKRSDTIILC